MKWKNVLIVWIGLLVGCGLGSTALPQTEAAVWKQCPMPSDGVSVPLDVQFDAWNTAKKLSRRYDVVKKFPLPCHVIRYPELFRGDPDDDGPLPPGLYQGIHLPPSPFMINKTGEIIACEYILIFLPPELESELENTLVHEYLHALFYRLMTIDPVTRDRYVPDDSERWVRERMK